MCFSRMLRTFQMPLVHNFKDPIHLYNFKSEYYISLQFYIKTSKVISNVFYSISKVIVIVIITFLQVL